MLHSFNGKAGNMPTAGLIFDGAGNLYGTTGYGGDLRCTQGCGMVFELTHTAGGTWTEKVVHSFHGRDGALPYDSLTLDASGNLYGTTFLGGLRACFNHDGCGVVFELTPGANGKWTEKVLYRFADNGRDGYYPRASLIFDAAGNLYGTTSAGGSSLNCTGGCGTVFQLAPGAHGKWTEKVLYSFDNTSGAIPNGLIFDSTGNLYGTTYTGGIVGCLGEGCGTVFELEPDSNGKWTEKVLYSFNPNGNDGFNPNAGVILDRAGNLYGTTFYGGSGSGCYYGCGTVFQLTPGTNSNWIEKVLYSFNFNGNEGYNPYAGVIVDGAGKLYGTTPSGGDGSGSNCCGAVFQLTPGAGDNWTGTALHRFSNQGKDGYFPFGGLIIDKVGDLYGTTWVGGAHGYGTVFQVEH